jgi:hypothetical protein
MRMSERLLLLMTAGLAMAAFAACRTSGPGASPNDTARPSQQSDSATSASPAIGARADSVVLRTDKTQYHAGERMTLTLENKSASSYAFNPCTRSLERETGGSWSAVPEEGRMCTMEAWILDPRGTRSGDTELPASLAAGRYRVVVRMTMESPGGAAASAVSAVSDPIVVS